MWNWFSPFWDKIAERLYNRTQPEIKRIYSRIPKKCKIIFGIIFAIFTIGISVLIIVRKINNTDITIVDIEISEVESTTANVKFIIKNNNTESDRYINKVVIHIKDYYEMAYDDTICPYRLEPSYTYNVIILGDDVPGEQIIDMSQVIPGGGFDEFIIKVAGCEDNIFREVLAKIEFEFICDNGEKIKSSECILALGCVIFDENVLESDLNVWRGVYENYIALKRFGEYKCKYVMDNFYEVYNSYKPYEDVIMDKGKDQYILEMGRDKNKIEDLNYVPFSRYLTRIYDEYELAEIDLEDNITDEEDKKLILAVNYKLNDKENIFYSMYFLCDINGKIYSIYLPAKENEIDFLPQMYVYESIFCVIDPSINHYWFEQRVVDLMYHENVRFWNDNNIYAKFVNFKGQNMLQIDLK